MRRAIKDSLTIIAGLLSCTVLSAQDQTVEQLNEYGTLDRWSVRKVKESGIIGGKTKYLYEFFGAQDTTETREPFTAPDGYLWRTNNVLAVVSGVTKTSNTVFPEKRGNGYCARIETHIETVKAMGIINMDVVCQGAFLLGSLPEPIKDTKNPMSKVLYGIPFTGRPAALVLDYKADVGHEAVRGTGFSKLKSLGYPDYPEIAVILQKRWEDKDGNIFSKRVGTMVHRYAKSSDGWVNEATYPILYGDITKHPDYRNYMRIQVEERYTTNSKGESVPIQEVGWADANETPTHMVLQFVSSHGGAYIGSPGNTFWIDNLKLVY